MRPAFVNVGRSSLGPKPWFFICASYRRGYSYLSAGARCTCAIALLSDMIFMVIVFHPHLAPGLGDGVANALSF